MHRISGLIIQHFFFIWAVSSCIMDMATRIRGNPKGRILASKKAKLKQTRSGPKLPPPPVPVLFLHFNISMISCCLSDGSCCLFQDPSTIAAIQSQVTLLVRAMYSNPPAHGARIVQTVLHDPALYQEISLVDTIFCSVYRNCTSALATGPRL